MSGLSNGDLNYMRKSVEELLPDMCNILEAVTEVDGEGGVTQTWGTVLADVRCRLDAINTNSQNNEVVVGGALRPFHMFVLSLPHGTSIAETNRVEVNGRVFNVAAVDSGKSWSAVVRVSLEAV